MAPRPKIQDPVLFDADWSQGMVRDRPRHTIPPGGCYDAADFILSKPGLAYKRGGWAYQSDAFGTTNKATKAVMFMPSPVRVIGIGFNNTAYDITSGTSASIGAVGFCPNQNPPFFVDMFILCDPAGAAPPKKLYWSGSALTLAALGGSPPNAALASTYAGRVVLARNTANLNRLFFSPYPDPESTWDTANAFIDVSQEVTGMAAIQGTFLIFQPRAVERILGGVPPGTEGENMQLQPVGDVGCIDARSIAVIDNNVIFASHAGVYMTNGAGLTNLMEKSDATGILSYWQSLFSTTTFTAVSGGMLGRDYYFINVLNAPVSDASTAAACLMCYLPTKSWWRVTNLAATMFATGLTEAGTHRLFAGLSNINRAAALEGILLPTSSNKLDGNGTAVAPMLETRMIGDSPGLKEYGHGHITYDLRDAASDNPELEVRISRGMNATSFTEVAESGLAETADADRKRFTVGGETQALTYRFTQVGASSLTNLYLVETDVRPWGLQGDGE